MAKNMIYVKNEVKTQTKKEGQISPQKRPKTAQKHIVFPEYFLIHSICSIFQV